MTIDTKSDVFALADEIQEFAAAVTAELDVIEQEDIEEQSESLEPDTQTPTLIADIVARTCGRLSEIAYRAKQERTYTMPRDEEMYSLVYRLMGGETPDASRHEYRPVHRRERDGRVGTVRDEKGTGGEILCVN